MKPLTRALVMINLIALLGYMIWSVSEKEILLEEGELLLFDLAPVDPRSLIQGDYMTLRYAEARNFMTDSIPKTGYMVVTLDSLGVAQKQRLQETTEPLNKGEYLVNYTASNWRLNIGAESYFFQEGQAPLFDSARYGGVRVDEAGNSLLVGLYDTERRLITPPE